MGSSDNVSLKPVTFGSYSADGVLGKIEGMSSDSMNIRYDLFGGIESILGNTAFNANACGGAYNLGGDIFQYIRKNGSFDVILGRQKAEGKMYKVPAATTRYANTINTTAGWNAGTPTGGDNLLVETTDTLIQKNITFGSPLSSTILNPDFESSFTNWTVVGNWGIDTVYPEHGTKYAVSASSVTYDVPVVKILTGSGTVIGTYGINFSATWAEKVITANLLFSSLGQTIKIQFVNGTQTLTSTAFTYGGDNIRFWYKAGWVNTSYQTTYFHVDNITVDLGASVSSAITWSSPEIPRALTALPIFKGAITSFTFDDVGSGYSVNDVLTIVQAGASGGTIRIDTVSGGRPMTGTILTAGSNYTPAGAVATTVSPSGGTGSTIGINTINTITGVVFAYSQSFDNITYGAYTGITTALSSGNIAAPIYNSNVYVKIAAIPYESTLGGSCAITNCYLGAQWVSATQDLTDTPVAWNLFDASYSSLSQTCTFEMDTSVDGTTWDGYETLLVGAVPTNPYRRYIRYRITLETTDYTALPQVTSLTLDYTLNTASTTLVQLTGWGGTGYNTYFGVLNNLLVISDGTTSPMTWSGTGTAFTAMTGAPSGMFPEVHCNRYFLAYSPAYPSRIWWSAADDPTTWDLATQFIDVNPDDGDQITGIKSYAGVLYVFKHRHAYIIQGNDFNPTFGNFSVQPMQQVPGCESHNSIVIAGDGNMYWYSNKGLVQCSGSYTPKFIGRGFIDQTVLTAGFKQNLTTYNKISAVDFTKYNELWISFGHTIYTYNYAIERWSRIFFDNNDTGNTVFSLVQYNDPYTNNIMSFTGQNVIEQWNDAPTFYINSYPAPHTTAIASYYTTDALDKDWYTSKVNYKALLSIRPLTATEIYLNNYMDFSTTSVASTISIVCPTSTSPNQYMRVDLPAVNGRRLQIKISCNALQFGLSDMVIQTETADGGRL